MFKGKVIVITGGSSGLGKALVERFVKKGASVAMIARDQNKLAAVKDKWGPLVSNHQRLEAFPCDISDADATQRTFSRIADTLGPPAMLINCAGVLQEGYFEKLPLATFHEILGINYFGTINCIRAVLPFFKRQGGGQIVNVASLGGRIGSFGYTAYCSSKFAVVGLTETLRTELKPQNIKLHLVCPGEFDSPMVDALNTYRTVENRVNTQTAPVLPLDFVAEKILAGIEKGRYLIIPGWISRVLDTVHRIFPSLIRAVVDAKIAKAYVGPTSS